MLWYARIGEMNRVYKDTIRSRDCHINHIFKLNTYSENVET